MASFAPDQLAQSTAGSWQGDVPTKIEGFCFDARCVQPGECFVALSDGARDGHAFVAQAFAGGAVAAIVEVPQPIDLPQLVVADSLVAMAQIAAVTRSHFTGSVVGVTGSCGKTSTKEMLRALLGPERSHATAGNWNNRIGVPMTLFGLDAQAQDYAVVEAGINQPGEMELLGEMIQADLTIITNIEAAHLELLGSLENVAQEKAQLARCAADGSPIILPLAAFQYPAFQAFASRAIVLCPEGQVPFAETQRCVEYALQVSGAGHELQLIDGAVLSTYRIASSSAGICANAALAILAARQLGLPEAAIRAGIESWQPVGNRGRVVEHGEALFYIDCYNANPASMGDALEAFDRAAPEVMDRIYILGAMNELGADAVAQHHAIGAQLDLRLQDRAYFVGPDDLVEAYQLGALSTGVPLSQLFMADSVEKIKSTIADFKGARFLKGSRAYRLETLLPQAILNS